MVAPCFGESFHDLEDTAYFSHTHDDSPTECESHPPDSSSSGSTSCDDQSRQEDCDVDSMPLSSEEESIESELEEDNDVEVVWAKSARGISGLGHVSGVKLYFTRDICEEKWIPKDSPPPKKKSVPAPKATARPAPRQAGWVAQAGAKPAAKSAPCSSASSSSAGATHPVPQFALKYPCNPLPPKGAHCHLAAIPPPGGGGETVARYGGRF